MSLTPPSGFQFDQLYVIDLDIIILVNERVYIVFLPSHRLALFCQYRGDEALSLVEKCLMLSFV